MLKKTITFTNFNDEECTDDFYFNLTEAELALMDASRSGGMQAYLERIVRQKDITKIAEEFQALIRKAYGVKSDDGRRFIKSEQLSDEFEQTNAYSELVVEILSDEAAAAAFISGIMPKKLQEQMKAAGGTIRALNTPTNSPA